MLTVLEPWVLVLSCPIEASICSFVSKASIPVMKMQNNMLKTRQMCRLNFSVIENIALNLKKNLENTKKYLESNF